MPYHEYNVPASQVGPVFLDWLKPLLNGHPSWEFVETVLDGTTWRYDVYRNIGNTFGVPFYLVVRVSQTTSWSLSVAIAETWDEVAKTLNYYAPQLITLTPNALDLYRIPSNPKTLVADSHADVFFTNGTATTSARVVDVWWNDDMFFGYTSVDAVPHFAGILTDVWNPGVDPLVLFVGTAADKRVNREPQYGGVNSFVAGFNGLISTPAAKDALSNSYFFTPVYLASRGGTLAWRGLAHSDFKRGLALSVGDRITIDGVEHVYLGGNYVAIPG